MTASLETPPRPPTTQDLEAVDWRSLVNADAARCCEKLWRHLSERFRLSEDRSERRVLRLLLHVTGFVVKQKDRTNGPLQPRLPGTEVTALGDEDFAAIQVFLSHAELHSDLRARLLDAQFLRKRGSSDEWRKAPRAYLDAAKALAADGNLTGVPDRLERGWALSRTMKLDEEGTAIEEFLKALLNKGADEAPTPDHLALMVTVHGWC